jgi:predicted TIM-barrel fold metal-dependent hydrolase
MYDFNVHLPSFKSNPNTTDIHAALSELDKLYLEQGFSGGVITNFDTQYNVVDFNSELEWKCFIQCKSFNESDQIWNIKSRGEELEIIGVKIHPRNLGFVPSVDQLVFAMKQMVNCNRILFICTYPPIGPGMLGSIDFMSRIVDALSQVPSAKVVLGHGGVSRILEFSEIARRFENVFLDISFTLTRMRRTSVAVDLSWLFQTLDTRLVFGSDFPDQSLKESVEAFDYLSQSLPIEKREKILSTNARHLGGFRS